MTDAFVALIVLNLATFAAFGIDKVRAKGQRRRLQESSLLWFAALGGTPGAYAGRAVFRHKTRKQPFSGRLHAIAAAQVLVFGLGLAWGLAG